MVILSVREAITFPLPANTCDCEADVYGILFGPKAITISLRSAQRVGPLYQDLASLFRPKALAIILIGGPAGKG